MIQEVLGWVLLACFGLIFELKTAGFFYFLSFSCAATVAAVCAWYGCSVELQIGVFCISSLVTFLVLKRWAGVSQHKHYYKSNIDALIGKEGVVSKEISPHATGYVSLKGQIWLAQALHGDTITVGTIVEVVRVEGVRLLVKIKE